MSVVPPSSAFKVTSDYRQGGSRDPQLSYSQTASASDQPRAVVQIGNYRAIPLEYSVERNAHGVTDSASFTLTVAGTSEWSTVLAPDFPNGQIPVAIYAGFPSNVSIGSTDVTQLSRRFSGILDDYDVDALADTWQFQCRSLGAILTDQKVTTQSQNQTTVDFVQTMAAQFQLRAVIELKPGQVPETLQGVYGRDFLVGLKNMRIWDIFMDAAEVDDVDVWVHDDIVYYVSADQVVPLGLGHVKSLRYGQDLKTFTGKHSPTFNKNISVEVRTYNPKVRHSVSVRIDTDGDGNPVASASSRTITTTPIFGQNASSSETSATSASGNTSETISSSQSSGGAFSTGAVGTYRESSKERYILRIPMLTQAQANRRALTYWTQLSRNEYPVMFSKAVMTSSDIKDIDVTTRYELSNIPQKQFNSGKKRPYYYPRQINETFSLAQADDGDSGGWEYTVHASSNELPQGSV